MVYLTVLNYIPNPQLPITEITIISSSDYNLALRPSIRLIFKLIMIAKKYDGKFTQDTPHFFNDGNSNTKFKAYISFTFPTFKKLEAFYSSVKKDDLNSSR